VIVGSDDDGCLGRCLDLCGVESLELGRRDVTERLVQPCAVEPAEVLDDGEFELAAGAPDTIADQLGLDRVDEGLREGVDAPIVVKWWLLPLERGGGDLGQVSAGARSE
jgi:hypothetical protein